MTTGWRCERDSQGLCLGSRASASQMKNWGQPVLCRSSISRAVVEDLSDVNRAVKQVEANRDMWSSCIRHDTAEPTSAR